MSKLDPKSEAGSIQQDDDEIEILEIVGLDESPAIQIDDPDEAAAGETADLILDFDHDGDARDAREASALEHSRRVQADFENYKKRVEREREVDQRQASARIVQNLLPVLDNFERAISSATVEESSSCLTGLCSSMAVPHPPIASSQIAGRTWPNTRVHRHWLMPMFIRAIRSKKHNGQPS